MSEVEAKPVDPDRQRRDLDHQMYVNINQRQDTLRKSGSHEWEHWLYEGKGLAGQIGYLTKLFEKERTGTLPDQFKYCSLSPTEAVPENKLMCCLGTEPKDHGAGVYYARQEETLIEITQTIEDEFPRTFAKARDEKPWISKLAVDTYRVVPRTADHGKYMVKFKLRHGRMFAECINLLTGEPCKSGLSHRLCYHRAAAVIHIDNLANRQSERKAA